MIKSTQKVGVGGKGVLDKLSNTTKIGISAFVVVGVVVI